MKLIYVLPFLLFIGGHTANADWKLNGDIEPPPIEDIKGEVGSDMNFGFVKNILSSAAKLVGDDKVEDRIKQSEEGRNPKAVTAGEWGGSIAKAGTSTALGGGLATKAAKVTIEKIAEKVTKLEKDNVSLKDKTTTLEKDNKVLKDKDTALQKQLDTTTILQNQTDSQVADLYKHLGLVD